MNLSKRQYKPKNSQGNRSLQVVVIILTACIAFGCKTGAPSDQEIRLFEAGTRIIFQDNALTVLRAAGNDDPWLAIPAEDGLVMGMPSSGATTVRLMKPKDTGSPGPELRNGDLVVIRGTAGSDPRIYIEGANVKASSEKYSVLKLIKPKHPLNSPDEFFRTGEYVLLQDSNREGLYLRAWQQNEPVKAAPEKEATMFRIERLSNPGSGGPNEPQPPPMPTQRYCANLVNAGGLPVSFFYVYAVNESAARVEASIQRYSYNFRNRLVPGDSNYATGAVVKACP